MLHSMCKLKSKKGRCAIKFDLSKAYDQMEWPFIRWVLQQHGFSDQWIRYLISCVSSTSFQTLINGHRGAKFQPSRGLR